MKEQIQLSENTLSCHWDDLIKLGTAEFQAEFETRLANKTMDDYSRSSTHQAQQVNRKA